MRDRNLVSNLGIYVYGGAGIFLGLVGLLSGNFAVTWQHVGPNAPFREPLAYFTALVELAAGIAVIVPRTARIGAVTLTIVYSVFTLLWVPKAFVDVFALHYDAMGNIFEEFSMVVGGLVLCAVLMSAGSAWSRSEALFARLFGICSISFGIVQILDTMPGLTRWIPKWLPPNQLFWVYATTVSFFLAAAAILTGIMAPLAARLLTAEIVGFQILVWIPKVVAGPREHFNWAGNSINLAIAAAAWVVSDSISRLAKRKPAPVPAEAASGA
ncbi:MAG TPA: hypothetical protein VGR47_08545 [Terracidiphilus sp.]|nr:hypothetical protein [Terracidiphilus sp.]HEV2398010.1 hypothetical protein [Candidatus Sulfotelmatobacter sp.]